MNVRDLIKNLQTLPQDMDVVMPEGMGYGNVVNSIGVCYFDPNTQELCEDKELLLSSDKAIKVVSFGSAGEDD